MTDWDVIEVAGKKTLRFWVEDIADLVDQKLHRIRLGVYDSEKEGDLRAVLEDIEGVLK